MNEAIEKQYNPRTTVTPEQLAHFSELGGRLSEQARQKDVTICAVARVRLKTPISFIAASQTVL